MIPSPAFTPVTTTTSITPVQSSTQQTGNQSVEFVCTFAGAGHRPTPGQPSRRDAWQGFLDEQHIYDDIFPIDDFWDIYGYGAPSGTQERSPGDMRAALAVHGETTVKVMLADGSSGSRMRELRSGVVTRVVSGQGRLTTCVSGAGPTRATAETPRPQRPADKSGEGMPLCVDPSSKLEARSLPSQTVGVLDWFGNAMIGPVCGHRLVVKDGTILKRGTEPAEEKMPETLLKAVSPDTDLIKSWSEVAQNGSAAWNATVNRYVATIVDALKPFIEAHTVSAHIVMLGSLRDEDKLPALRCILSDNARGGVNVVRDYLDELESMFDECQQGDLKQLLREFNVVE
ncbi:hypothetical protein [Pandoraea sputorum]|uniref:hypothetical protein n=1 Tax=Pandoraea sputorum TaxID=93222 RepID=UPI002B326434|nr:hypothetical protein THI4931_20020 [Pandoraea sputorum]